jgi:hypothetical protein
MKNLIAGTLLTLVVIITFTSCRNNNRNSVQTAVAAKMNKISWILGEWIQSDSAGTFHEKWIVNPDNSFDGIGYLMVENDTIFAEDLQIRISGDNIYYVPTLINQNDGKEVLFRLDSLTDNLMIFENSQHDFPTRIIYTHPTSDSLHAWIEGIDKGKQRREDFRMARKK